MHACFKKILIANRGEIACRVIRTAHRMGMNTVAVYSDADRESLHVEMAGEAVHIGPSPVGESYLVGERIIAAALETGAQAIHPGYGFLSENPGFVEAVEAAGLTFIGPSPDAIRAMGLKDAAKDLMEKAGVPVVPGYQGSRQELAFLAEEAEGIGYPVLIKARAGGGGKGMRKVERAEDFADALKSASREAAAAFGDPHVLIEKFITAPRHIEVQVFGDSHGNVVHLFERDCSLQRRHQKVIEEAPAPGMSAAVRAAMTQAAVKAAEAIGYRGAGTIEFIADGSGSLRPDGFWFMEMNTRLQVEHPVTEMITSIDLVEWQLRVAAGAPLPLTQSEIAMNGHAFEARLYAEDPARDFLPVTGRLEHLEFPPEGRFDTGVRTGDVITPFYDPMIAKVITQGEDRETALSRLSAALDDTHVAGTATNAAFLAALSRQADFVAGTFDTGLIERELASLTVAVAPAEEHVALAAILALGIDPDMPHLGWRAFGEAFHDVRLTARDRAYERCLSLGKDGVMTLSGGAEPVTLAEIAIDDALISARCGAARRRLTAGFARVRQPGGLLVSVHLNGRTEDFLLVDERAGAAALVDATDAVIAPMTGTIVQLSVSAGDVVEAGQKLGVMEAMKMETTLVAPRAGRVAAVECKEGATVSDGAVLVTFEEETP
ncbi:acetyl/propionyl/methylcrotonyl-CoA carboxylase subunit alpha [Martelella radicis]|uniref:3-methylcrotonyl-CoA carboxylase alpha subunit n=1 Tax=Martelella radicis TaxID=1397476 RepID=A0A7W6P9U6_9HYPH|nr:acetyl/propionyl/methylcrotonyl-CoA carboxylase subunit alpha [Martelella radicis]MBB4122677.1 3-methylcrotonyl-CoA carboxylase alpha subunit [Martelella radicis]